MSLFHMNLDDVISSTILHISNITLFVMVILHCKQATSYDKIVCVCQIEGQASLVFSVFVKHTEVYYTDWVHLNSQFSLLVIHSVNRYISTC